MNSDDNKLQRMEVLRIMCDGAWRTLPQLSSALGNRYMITSLSARLRDFRKKQYGNYRVEKRLMGYSDRFYEYRVLPPVGAEPRRAGHIAGVGRVAGRKEELRRTAQDTQEALPESKFRGELTGKPADRTTSAEMPTAPKPATSNQDAMPAPQPNALLNADAAMKNTDREIWRRKSANLSDPDGFYQPSIHVTDGGAIGISVHGFVIVMPVEKWHALAADRREGEQGQADHSREQYFIEHNPAIAATIERWDASHAATPQRDRPPRMGTFADLQANTPPPSADRQETPRCPTCGSTLRSVRIELSPDAAYRSEECKDEWHAAAAPDTPSEGR